LLAEEIARVTGSGAPAGGIALPSAASVAVLVPEVGVVGVVVVVLPGGGVPPVCAEAGTAIARAHASVSPATARCVLVLLVGDRKPFSFVGLRG
jgi:hypothetical protein